MRGLLVLVFGVACLFGGIHLEQKRRWREDELRRLYGDGNISIQVEIDEGRSYAFGDLDMQRRLAALVPLHRRFFRDRLKENLYVVHILAASPLNEEYHVKWSRHLTYERDKWLGILETSPQ